ncbi:hypothetical protein GCM10022408_28430 [Hymenobacter fastidiosus]|uniref:STAS/SEC14 domain-containing protein n=1 Tax=Hymenobacter fastidiosus TaxID=486264 RepID=A0ABP7SM81_9BACT
MPEYLRRPDGHVYLMVERDPINNWVYARWTGIQTLATIQEGGLFYVDMLRQHPCARLLNDHRELIGRFTAANEWIATVWTPLILQAGLRYFAQVVSPGIFGQLSIQDLHQRIGDQFQMQLFPDVEAARTWLHSCPD